MLPYKFKTVQKFPSVQKLHPSTKNKPQKYNENKLCSLKKYIFYLVHQLDELTSFEDFQEQGHCPGYPKMLEKIEIAKQIFCKSNTNVQYWMSLIELP